jgi:glycosyltransferase involved in cell wall biosynthesis
MTKFLFVELNLKRLGGGSRAAINIADILKGFGHEVKFYSIHHLENAFENNEDIPKYYPMKNLTLADFEEGDEDEQHYDATEVRDMVYPISPRLKELLDWCDYVVNSAEIFHNTFEVLYPGKLIIYLHVYPMNVYAKLMANAHLVIANGKHTQIECENACGVVPLRIYPPINPEWFDNSKPLADRKYDICFVGRIAPDKYANFDMELFNWQIQAKGYKAIMAGVSWQSNYDVNINFEKIKNVKYDDIAKIYNDSRIYIHTKTKEDFGQVICEALAAGCIVFVPDPSWSMQEFKNVIGYQDSFDLCLKVNRVLRSLDKYEQRKPIRYAEAKAFYDESLIELEKVFGHGV